MKKKDEDVRSIIVKIRMNDAEKKLLQKLRKESIERNLSNYARKVLLQKPVIITHHNQSADDFLKDMIALKKELNAIGNNFNQAVKKLHTLDKIPQFREWVAGYDSTRKTLLSYTEMINDRVAQLYEQWSQK